MSSSPDALTPNVTLNLNLNLNLKADIIITGRQKRHNGRGLIPGETVAMARARLR